MSYGLWNTPIMENELEKKLEMDRETAIYIYMYIGLYTDYMSCSHNSLKGAISGIM